MPIAEKEALASLKILVAMARADGTVHNDERRSLAAALERLALPGGTTIDELLAQDVDVDVELAALETKDAREQIYRSAYFMAYADGTCTPEEQRLLDRIALATSPSLETRRALDRTFARDAKGGETSSLEAIADPEKRSAEVAKWVWRYAAITAALGAFPIPGLAIATDLAVVAVQLKMIRDVGALAGHAVDKQAAKSILYGMGLGTGARLAIANLAKLLPGWGSVFGAATSFASTFALGKVMEKYFAGGGAAAANAEMLRRQFIDAEAIARAVYADHGDVIIQSQRFTKPAIDRLIDDLKAGTLTQDEFDKRIAELDAGPMPPL